MNRATAKTLPGAGTGCNGSGGINFTWDDASNLASICDKQGPLTYVYDAANRLISARETGGNCTPPGTLCTTFQYDDVDRRTVTSFPGGATQTFTYDHAGNITAAVGQTSTGGPLTNFSYTYKSPLVPTTDTALRQTMTENDPVANVAWTYSYDKSNRLTRASSTGTTLNYQYDSNGKRCRTDQSFLA